MSLPSNVKAIFNLATDAKNAALSDMAEDAIKSLLRVHVQSPKMAMNYPNATVDEMAKAAEVSLKPFEPLIAKLSVKELVKNLNTVPGSAENAFRELNAGVSKDILNAVRTGRIGKARKLSPAQRRDLGVMLTRFNKDVEGIENLDPDAIINASRPWGRNMDTDRLEKDFIEQMAIQRMTGVGSSYPRFLPVGTEKYYDRMAELVETNPYIPTAKLNFTREGGILPSELNALTVAEQIKLESLRDAIKQLAGNYNNKDIADVLDIYRTSSPETINSTDELLSLLDIRKALGG